MITRSREIFPALQLEIMEKAVQRLKDRPQAWPLGEEVLYTRSPKPCSNPLYVFLEESRYNFYTALLIFDLRKLRDLLNIGATPRQKVRLLRSFEPRLPLPLVRSSFAKRYLMKAMLAQA
jgi:hypothetical protein